MVFHWNLIAQTSFFSNASKMVDLWHPTPPPPLKNTTLARLCFLDKSVDMVSSEPKSCVVQTGISGSNWGNSNINRYVRIENIPKRRPETSSRHAQCTFGRKKKKKARKWMCGAALVIDHDSVTPSSERNTESNMSH